MNTHGGKRPRAGRKKKERKYTDRATVVCFPEHVEAIKAAALKERKRLEEVAKYRYRIKTQAEFEATCEKDFRGYYVCGDTLFNTDSMAHLYGHPVPNDIAEQILQADESVEAIIPCEGDGCWYYHKTMITENK